MVVEFQDVQEYFKFWVRKYMFPVGLILLQCVFIVLYAVHAEYGVRTQDIVNVTQVNYNNPPVEGNILFFYSFFQDVHVMMFIGFGFLMTFLRRYSFSSVSFNFLVAAFVLEWAILVRGYVFYWNTQTKSFLVDVQSLLHADFVCAAILISFGAIIGKTNPAQLVILSLIEVVLQVWNEYIGSMIFCTFDAGE
jgi:ammonium transporter Rh